MSQDNVAQAAPEAVAPVEGAEVTQTPENQEVQKPEAKKEDFLAPKFAALTRKEKQVRAYEAQLKAKEAELQKKFAEYEEKSKNSQSQESSLLAEMKANPLKFMSKHGLTFEQLMEMQMNNENPTTEMQIKQMRDELREEIMREIGGVKETLKEKEEREAAERMEAAVSGYKQELSSFIEQNAEKYELIVANGATELMFEVAQQFHEQTGRVPSNEEVAQAVEEHLEEQIAEIAKLKKVQTKFGTLSAPKTEAKPKEAAPTLSNTLAAEVPKNGSKLLSDEESKREAAKLIRWGE